MIVNVYVDGFNLYYGSLKGTPYRWLDLRRLSGRLLSNDTIQRVRYFTAFISARPGDPVNDPGRRQRQQTYLRALRTIPNLSIHTGHYLSSTKRRPLAHPPQHGPRIVEVLDSQEKGSDVNLASYLLLDAFDRDCEAMAIISNDSDLRFPVEIVRTRFGLPAGIFNPQANASRTLRATASFYRQIHPADLRASQLPAVLADVHGTIRKPAGW